MRMQVILDSSLDSPFARPGSAPVKGGKKGEFSDWTSFLCVCPVIDHGFRHNIVKVAVDPRGDSGVDPQTT